MRLENEKNLEYLLGQHFAKNFSHDIIYKKNNQNKFGQKINQIGNHILLCQIIQ